MNAELNQFFNDFMTIKRDFDVVPSNKDLLLHHKVIFASKSYKTGYTDSTKKESVTIYIEILKCELQHTDKVTKEVTVYTGNQAKIRMDSLKDLKANLASQVLIGILFAEKASPEYYGMINHSAKTFRESSITIGNNTYSIDGGKILSVSTDKRCPSEKYIINAKNKTFYAENNQPDTRKNGTKCEYPVINSDRYDSKKFGTNKKFKLAK